MSPSSVHLLCKILFSGPFVATTSKMGWIWPAIDNTLVGWLDGVQLKGWGKGGSALMQICWWFHLIDQALQQLHVAGNP